MASENRYYSRIDISNFRKKIKKLKGVESVKKYRYSFVINFADNTVTYVNFDDACVGACALSCSRKNKKDYDKYKYMHSIDQVFEIIEMLAFTVEIKTKF